MKAAWAALDKFYRFISCARRVHRATLVANGHPGRKKQIWFGDGRVMKEARCSCGRGESRVRIKDAGHEIQALGTSTIYFDTESYSLHKVTSCI